jgi:hypothetical protein
MCLSFERELSKTCGQSLRTERRTRCCQRSVLGGVVHTGYF